MPLPLPPDKSIDDVLLRIKETNKNPNVGKTTQLVLKGGPRAYKVATLFEILRSESKELHHYSLRLEHFQKKKEGWFSDPARIVSLEASEVEGLHKMLAAVYGGKLADKVGDVHVVSGKLFAGIEQLIAAIPESQTSDKLSVLEQALKHIGGEARFDQWVGVFNAADPATLQNISAASRMIEYQAAHKELQNLIDAPETVESEFQTHLEKHPWMFGSEYSELLSRKTWTRDDRLDYMLRRTVDSYLEIVEIKRAFSDDLFIWDTSHECYYPSAKLSQVIGQVMRYIDEVERNRDSILAKDKEDTLKIRARAIVGRDGDADQQAALRNFNAHLYRIEILTYDQLLRIADRVLTFFRGGEGDKGSSSDIDFDDDIPF